MSKAHDAPAAQSNGAIPPKWLVMVYMQASDTSSLDSLAVQDLCEMEEGLRANPHVQVLVQIHRKWPALPQRYLLKAQADQPVVAEIVGGPDHKAEDGDKLIDMGTREALADFLAAGSAYKAENNCLILWGHAFGIGFGRDHHDPLMLGELRGALLDFKTLQEENGRKRLDVLGTNACTMSYIEAVVELDPMVDYLVASEVFVPLVGLPYKPILSSIGLGTDAIKLGKVLVDCYIEHFATPDRDERVAMSVVRVGQTRELREQLNKLAQAIDEFIGQGENTDFDRLSKVRDVFFANPAGDTRPVLDLISLADDLITLGDRLGPNQPGVTSLSEAARRLKDTIKMGDDQLLVYHRGHGDLDDLHGIGIFAPFVIDTQLLQQLELEDEKGKRAYEGLTIFNSGHDRWVSLVYTRLRLDKPDEIVDATGVVRPAERTSVNQMIVAIEATFNQLKQLLDVIKPKVIAETLAETEAINNESKRLAELAGTFGPPYLRLAGDFSLALSPDEALSKKLGGRRPKNAAPASPLVKALATIEDAVHRIEKATKRVVTNTTFGLGPPDTSSGSSSTKPLGFGFKPQELGFKPQELGFKPQELGFKPQELGFKPQELGFKPQELGFKQQELGFKPQELGFKQQELGLQQWGSQVGALSAFLSSDEQVAMLAVSVLFSHVALALAQLEDAAGTLESTAALFVFRPDYGSLLSTTDYQRVITDRLDAAFGAMKEAADSQPSDHQVRSGPPRVWIGTRSGARGADGTR